MGSEWHIAAHEHTDTYTWNYFTSIRFLLEVKWKGTDSIFNHRLIRLLVTFAKKVFHKIRLGPRLVVLFNAKNKEEACSNTHYGENIQLIDTNCRWKKRDEYVRVCVCVCTVAVLKQWIELGTFVFRCRYAMLTKTVNKRIKPYKLADNKNRRTSIVRRKNGKHIDTEKHSYGKLGVKREHRTWHTHTHTHSRNSNKWCLK